MNDFVKVGRKIDFPVNRTRMISIGGRNICVAHWSGGFYAFDEQCTHAEASLADIEIEDGAISCLRHGAKFSVQSGAPLTLPATQALNIYQVKIEGDNVCVKLESKPHE